MNREKVNEILDKMEEYAKCGLVYNGRDRTLAAKWRREIDGFISSQQPVPPDAESRCVECGSEVSGLFNLCDDCGKQIDTSADDKCDHLYQFIPTAGGIWKCAKCGKMRKSED